MSDAFPSKIDRIRNLLLAELTWATSRHGGLAIRDAIEKLIDAKLEEKLNAQNNNEQ